MTLEERAKAAIHRITQGLGSMRIPADKTDPDIVITDLLAELAVARQIDKSQEFELSHVRGLKNAAIKERDSLQVQLEDRHRVTRELVELLAVKARAKQVDEEPELRQRKTDEAQLLALIDALACTDLGIIESTSKVIVYQAAFKNMRALATAVLKK